MEAVIQSEICLDFVTRFWHNAVKTPESGWVVQMKGATFVILNKPFQPYLFAVVQCLSQVQFFVTPCTAACQTPLCFTFPELAQIHVHWVSDAIQPSLSLSPPSPFARNVSQHQGLSQWVSSLHQVVKVLELQLQHHSFQWILRVDFL